MIRIVATFGAPVTEPLGKSARNTSSRLARGASCARMEEVSCQTVSNRSARNTSDQVTEPSRATRPRSLRSRSTIIAFSAPILDRPLQPVADRVVLRGEAAARRGPFHRPGLEHVAVDPEEQLRGCREHADAARVEVGAVGASLGEAEIAVQPARLAFQASSQPEGVVDLVRLARRDVLVDRVRASPRRSRGLRSASTPRRRRRARPPAGRGASSPGGPRTSRTTRAARPRRVHRAAAPSPRAPGRAPAQPRTRRIPPPTGRERRRPRPPPGRPAPRPASRPAARPPAPRGGSSAPRP